MEGGGEVEKISNEKFGIKKEVLINGEEFQD